METNKVVINNKTGEISVCGSLISTSSLTGIKQDTLKYHFSRKKKTDVDLQGYKILKRPVLRSKHSKNDK